MFVLNILLYYIIIIPISLLPFPVLYRLSDLLYLLFYYLVNYRKKVIVANIQNSFPEKTKKEQLEICRKFYKHLCDLIVESLKIFTISEKQVHQRMTCEHPELVNKFFEENKSIIIAGGHYNNWELMAVAVDKLIKHKAVGIYQPLKNKFFDAKMCNTRSKFGLKMIATKEVKKFFELEINNLNATIFAIDQSPSNPNTCYWTTFLNQDTAVSFGAEKYAKEYNFPVIFGRIVKVKRGHYSFEFELITENPINCAHGEITEKLTAKLESDIIKDPEYWLWSHRRWKHKKPVNQ